MNSMARRMFELVEPIGVIPYSADEPNEAMFPLGFDAAARTGSTQRALSALTWTYSARSEGLEPPTF